MTDPGDETLYSRLIEFEGKRVLLIKDDALVSRETFSSAHVCLRFRDGLIELCSDPAHLLMPTHHLGGGSKSI